MYNSNSRPKSQIPVFLMLWRQDDTVSNILSIASTKFNLDAYRGRIP